MSNEEVHKIRTDMLVNREKERVKALEKNVTTLIASMGKIAKHTSCHFASAIARDAINSSKEI